MKDSTRSGFDVAVVGVNNQGLAIGGAQLIKGSRVLFIDADRTTIAHLGEGRVHVREEGLSEALYAYRTAFAATCNIERVREADLIYVTAPVPVQEGGRPSYDGLITALQEVCSVKRADQPMLVTSPVYPGGMVTVHDRLSLPAADASIVLHPIFVRLGHGIEDYSHAAKTIFGVRRPDPSFWTSLEEVLKLTRVEGVDHFAVLSYEEAEWVATVHQLFTKLKSTMVAELRDLLQVLSPTASLRNVLQATFVERRIGRANSLLSLADLLPAPPRYEPVLEVLSDLVQERWDRYQLMPSVNYSQEADLDCILEKWAKSDGPHGIIGLPVCPQELPGSFAINAMALLRDGPREWDAQVEGLWLPQASSIAYDPAYAGLSPSDLEQEVLGDAATIKLLPDLVHTLHHLWSTCRSIVVTRKLFPAEIKQLKEAKPGLTRWVIDLFGNDWTGISGVRLAHEHGR